MLDTTKVDSVYGKMLQWTVIVLVGALLWMGEVGEAGEVTLDWYRPQNVGYSYASYPIDDKPYVYVPASVNSATFTGPISVYPGSQPTGSQRPEVVPLLLLKPHPAIRWYPDYFNIRAEYPLKDDFSL